MTWIDITSRIVQDDPYTGLILADNGVCGVCRYPVAANRLACCEHVVIRAYQADHSASRMVLTYAASVEDTDDGWVINPVVPVTHGVRNARDTYGGFEAYLQFRVQEDGSTPRCFRCCESTEGLIYAETEYAVDYRVCVGCAPDCGFVIKCSECELCVDASGVTYATVQTLNGVETRTVCATCFDDCDWGRCDHCDLYRSGDMETCCPVNDEGIVPNCRCYTCRRQAASRPSAINAYSYRPELRFLSVGGDVRHGVGKHGKVIDRTPYLGFELEVEVSREKDLQYVARKFSKAMGDDFYLKSDGSIGHGFEIVSHPMTLEYAMTRVNWRAIRDLRKEKVIYSQDNCGMHVHVSKEAFSSRSHVFRWMMMFHRNRFAMQALAGRESGYARFDNTNRAHIPTVVKGLEDGRNTERYSAINMINPHTFEVRIFESSVYVNRIQAYLQLVEATVEYTRNLVASKVMSDGGFSFGEFRTWLNANRSRYAHLIQRIKATVPDIGYGLEPIKESYYGFQETYYDEGYREYGVRNTYRTVVVQEN